MVIRKNVCIHIFVNVGNSHSVIRVLLKTIPSSVSVVFIFSSFLNLAFNGGSMLKIICLRL